MKRPEGEGVKPVAVEVVKATLPNMPVPVRAMAELQLLTGMRVGEVLVMRAIDLTMSGSVWTYRPAKHKNKYRGHDRVIYLGPQAQDILRPFLTTDLTAYLFAPRAATAARNAAARARCKTKKTPSQLARKPKANPKRALGRRTTGRGFTARPSAAPARRSACRPGIHCNCATPPQRPSAPATGWKPPRPFSDTRRFETSQIYAEAQHGPRRRDHAGDRVGTNIGPACPCPRGVTARGHGQALPGIVRNLPSLLSSLRQCATSVATGQPRSITRSSAVITIIHITDSTVVRPLCVHAHHRLPPDARPRHAGPLLATISYHARLVP